MLVVYNPIGMLMVFVPAVLLSFGAVYVPETVPVAWPSIGAWGLTTFIWDVIHRIFNREEHWLNPRRGGHIFFIPVFLLGLLAIWSYAHKTIATGQWIPAGTGY